MCEIPYNEAGIAGTQASGHSYGLGLEEVCGVKGEVFKGKDQLCSQRRGSVDGNWLVLQLRKKRRAVIPSWWEGY